MSILVDLILVQRLQNLTAPLFRLMPLRLMKYRHMQSDRVGIIIRLPNVSFECGGIVDGTVRTEFDQKKADIRCNWDGRAMVGSGQLESEDKPEEAVIGAQ